MWYAYAVRPGFESPHLVEFGLYGYILTQTFVDNNSRRSITKVIFYLKALFSKPLLLYFRWRYR